MRCVHWIYGLWTSSRVLSVAAGALVTVASLAAPSYAAVVSFGTGANQFNMEFVTIGNPGNAADSQGALHLAGAVGYEYGMGKFEVSQDMITKFNASQPLQITHDNRGVNKPANYVSWNEAARFVNWLNTSTGNQAAYKFTTGGVNDDIALWTSGDAGYNASNPYRNSLARYVLPSYNEWFKAAYYDPNKSGGAGYWEYATGSNSAPEAVASGTGAGTAVFGQDYYEQGPADVDQAGGLSPYGVMGLGGNIFEWQESSYDLLNISGSSPRSLRGGDWSSDSFSMSSSASGLNDPSVESDDAGFRVVSLPVPEPSTMVIGTLFGLGGLAAKRRLKK